MPLLPQPIRIAFSPRICRPPRAARVVCLSAGKAAGALAFAAERHYLDEGRIAPEKLSGLATTRHGYGKPTKRIEVVEAGHPVPDEASLNAASRTLELAKPQPMISFWCCCREAVRRTGSRPPRACRSREADFANKSLLRSGAPIGEMNTVRKHLSRIRAENARAAAPAKILTRRFLRRAVRAIRQHRAPGRGARTRPRWPMPRDRRALWHQGRRCGDRGLERSPQ